MPRPRRLAMRRPPTRWEFRSRTVPRTGDIPAHRSEQSPCRSGTPRRDLAKTPWMSPVLWSEPIVVSSPLSELIGTTPISVWPRRGRHRAAVRRSERGFRLREPRNVDLPDQVPPFRGHRGAGFVAAVPVLHLGPLDGPARTRDHEGV